MPWEHIGEAPIFLIMVGEVRKGFKEVVTH